MDLIEQLPKSGGKDTILVVICEFSRHANFISMSCPFSATDVAKVFLDVVVKLHGVLLSIVIGRGKNFYRPI